VLPVLRITVDHPAQSLIIILSVLSGFAYACAVYFISMVPCIMTILIRSNKMQQYAGVYLLLIYSTCFGRPSRPSSGVHKTVTADSGTGHSNSATTFLQRGLIRPRRKVVALLL